MTDKRLATHDLRRTFAKLARSNGADIEQIQFSLGHESIDTTQRYLGSEINDVYMDKYSVLYKSLKALDQLFIAV